VSNAYTAEVSTGKYVAKRQGKEEIKKKETLPSFNNTRG